MKLPNTLFTLCISCIICCLYIQKTISYYVTPSISHASRFLSSSTKSDRKIQLNRVTKRRNKISPLLQLYSSLEDDDEEEEKTEAIVLIPSEDPIKDLIVKLKGTCVFFVGPMGSGKSTLGE